MISLGTSLIKASCRDQALIAGQNEIAHKASAVYGAVGFLHGVVGKPMGEIYGRSPLSEVQSLTPPVIFSWMIFGLMWVKPCHK